MTKYELSKAISDKLRLKINDVIPVVEAFMNVSKDTICKGNNIYLRGLGTFYIRKRARKPGRIISRNETIIIPAHNIVKFKPAKTFKKRLMKYVPVKV